LIWTPEATSLCFEAFQISHRAVIEREPRVIVVLTIRRRSPTEAGEWKTTSRACDTPPQLWPPDAELSAAMGKEVHTSTKYAEQPPCRFPPKFIMSSSTVISHTTLPSSFDGSSDFFKIDMSVTTSLPPMSTAKLFLEVDNVESMRVIYAFVSCEAFPPTSLACWSDSLFVCPPNTGTP